MTCQDYEQLRDYGMLQGFDGVVWTVVLLNSCGGLLVAAVMKYADNIVKCFAAALAILSGTLISVPLFNFLPSRLFALGGLCTVSATVLYSWAPTQWPEGWTRAGRQLQRRRATASLELDALDDQERLHIHCICICTARTLRFTAHIHNVHRCAVPLCIPLHTHHTRCARSTTSRSHSSRATTAPK